MLNVLVVIKIFRAYFEKNNKALKDKKDIAI